MKSNALPPQEELRKLLDYNPETGTFIWRERLGERWWWNGKFAGKEAGSRGDKGTTIYVHCVPYRAHLLAWVYMYGDIPEGMMVDHKNCDCYDNRIENLRLATHGQNCTNSRLRKGKVTPKGGSLYKLNGKFKATIGINKSIIHLGYFDTPEDAHAAYMKAAVAAKGEFARAA